MLVNCFDLIGDNGLIGLLHPESVYDDENGAALRREMYHRLRYHFQYQNAFMLFPIAHRRKYSTNVYGGRMVSIDFININNLFHPSTVDACFAHDGHGVCCEKKNDDNTWNTSGHRSRILRYGEQQLRTLSETFEDGMNGESTKLVSIHSQEIIEVLEKFSKFPKHVRDYQTIISEGLHETNAVDKGIMRRNTCVPRLDKYEMIYSGPHFFVGNPLYKSPRAACKLNSDYDNIDLTAIPEDYVQRTNYVPTVSIDKYKSLIQGFQIGQDEEGQPVYDDWFSHYKMGFRRMVGSSSERTLSGAILLPHTFNIGGVVTVMFKKLEDLVEFSAICSSLPLDFYLKVLGISDIHANRVNPFPLGVDTKYQPPLYLRTLLLNCLTRPYAELWEAMWRDEYCEQTWSVADSRLKPFDKLTKEWTWDVPLRNHFERRMALVEIDVLSAMALVLSLKDLETMYNKQFSVLKQNEQDTWYDARGNIVFTYSKGLTGVGVDRPVWEQIRRMQAGETYRHTIDPHKSELYGGREVTYYAPFTCCDRVADYRRAWQHFSSLLK